MKPQLIILAAVFGLSSCKFSGTPVVRQFEIDIPDTTKNVSSRRIYQYKNDLVDGIGLSHLENNVTDSVEIRFWHKVGVLNGGSVIVLKNETGSWQCLEYNYLESPIGEWGPPIQTYQVDSSWVTRKEPRINLSDFVAELNRLGIDNIQSQSDLEGWTNKGSDGVTYSIEFATADKYRFFSHNCPDVYSDDFPDCMKMMKITDVFDNAFDLHIIGGHRCKN